MINDYPEADESSDYSLAEFFIMFKFRRKGIGKTRVNKIFDLYHGKWQLKRHPKNISSVYFWNNIVSEYTKEIIDWLNLITRAQGETYIDKNLVK